MGVQDKPITVFGALTVLTAVTLRPQPDGSVQLFAEGHTVDSNAAVVQLNGGTLQMKGNPTLDALVTLALSTLRKANGLET